MLSHTTRKNSASLRSCSSLSATYFAKSLDRLRRLVSTRSTCVCIVHTCAGKKPRSPSASRSASLKAVPLLSSGSRNSARPRAEVEGVERALSRLARLKAFPPNVICFRPLSQAQEQSSRFQPHNTTQSEFPPSLIGQFWLMGTTRLLTPSNNVP